MTEICLSGPSSFGCNDEDKAALFGTSRSSGIRFGRVA